MTPLDLLYRQRAQLETEEQALVNILIEYYTKLLNRLPVDDGQANYLQVLLPVFEDELVKFTELIMSLGVMFSGTILTLAVANAKALTKSYFPVELHQAFEQTWETVTADQIKQNIWLPNQSHLVDAGIDGVKQAVINNSSIEMPLGLPLVWALTSVRTLQNYLYREATRLNYANNDEIIDGWIWIAKLDSRTCLSCWSKHGSYHSVDEVLRDHHNGRCSQLPVPKNIPKPSILTGESEFNKLTQKQQIDLMGMTRYTAYKKGKFSFDDLSRPYDDHIYGTMYRQASLKELV